tara:strand:- start:389 stop:1063 length:675 start_codon:yes stop_codon:yes gene_type:complete
MQTIRSVFAIFYREFKITFYNYNDVVSIALFFILGLLIFIFAIGPNKEIINVIGVGLIWSLLLLSSTLSIKKFYQDDFEDNNIFLLHMNGLSYELIVLVKIFSNWLFFQLPFLLILPFVLILLDIKTINIYFALISFVLSSMILTCIGSISGSMNLINNKNYTFGSLIVMILSIPLIIFSVNIVNNSDSNVMPQIQILTGIFLLFLAISPWISAACIKLAMRSK